MDWRFVDDERWQTIHDALNGAGVESMQAKWEEMFGEKKEEVVEKVKVKKPRKKAVSKKVLSKKAGGGKAKSPVKKIKKTAKTKEG